MSQKNEVDGPLIEDGQIWDAKSKQPPVLQSLVPPKEL